MKAINYIFKIIGVLLKIGVLYLWGATLILGGLMINLPILFLAYYRIIDSTTALMIGAPLAAISLTILFCYQEGGWTRVKKEFWDNIHVSLDSFF